VCVNHSSLLRLSLVKDEGGSVRPRSIPRRVVILAWVLSLLAECLAVVSLDADRLAIREADGEALIVGREPGAYTRPLFGST